jgi:P63C domain.
MSKQYNDETQRNKDDIIDPISASLDDVAGVVLNTSKSQIQPALQATHKGNFKKDFDIDVDCYVLNDKDKTAVISQRGMQAALGLGNTGGAKLTKFTTGKTISKLIGLELQKKIHNPLIFKGIPAAPNTPPQAQIYGYDVTILVDLCRCIIIAEEDGKLLKSQANIAKQAHVIVNASAKAGIKGLVYALVGYRPEFDEVIKSYRQFLVEEMSRDYAKEFPVELYLEWSKLYNFPLKVGKNHHIKCRWLTIEHVYTPLLKSNGRLLKMLREKRSQDDKGGYKKLFQYLNEEVGAPALRKHLQQLLAIAKVAKGNRQRYETDFNTLFGVQLEFMDELENANGE